MIEKAAAYDTTVLIQGESGTGKELVARALHERGSRASASFVAVNCGAIPDSLLESELFGHKRGAFTDASSDKPGLFEEAHGGTLFLDEIGELPLSTQVKLLRVLQEGTLRRLGENRDREVDVRVVAATVRNLKEEVDHGRFREDLFYRLNVLPIEVPPLRERRDDLTLLIDFFVERNNTRLGTRIRGVDAKAKKLLLAYHWPGNVRELAHVLERGVALAQQQVLTAEDLPLELRQPAVPRAKATFDDRPTLAELKRRYVRSVLEESGGNVSRAAAILGVDRRSLYRMLKRYGVTPRAHRQE
jgi:two-component system response regulator AtoC